MCGALADIALRTVPQAARVIDAHPDLRATLLAFAKHDLNVARAAESIHVHPNTVKYRLRRIEELTGADVRRFHSALGDRPRPGNAGPRARPLT